MLHENDHYKEKDGIRPRSFTRHHRNNNVTHHSLEIVGEEVFTSSDILSALKASLWTEYTDLTLGIGLKPIHYAIFGIVFVIIGSAILIARRERVTVTEEATVMLECPYCKHQWRESMSKTHLKSMGYPRVRTLSRRKCPKCAKFIRPKIAATNV